MFNQLIIASLLFAQVPPNNYTTNSDFIQLREKLESKGFTVKIAPPPQRSTYGVLQVKSRTIWIQPLVFDLGIELPTLIHEATHAAQVCRGKGEITTLNLGFSPPNIARPYFTHYNHGLRRHLEAEAYALQTHPDGLELVSNFLDQYC